MIDSHCHLADQTFAADLDAVVARAREAGGERALVILEGGNTTEVAQATRLEALWPETRFAVGVHPHQAHQFAGDPARAATIAREQFAAMPLARAVGEIGLDYHYDFSPRDVQHAVFRVADAGLELGLFISFAGILTFPKAAALRETARRVPIDRLLTETDSPFLAPTPYRGKRNEPAYVGRVVSALAEVHGVDALEVSRRTAANFHTLFRP